MYFRLLNFVFLLLFAGILWLVGKGPALYPFCLSPLLIFPLFYPYWKRDLFLFWVGLFFLSAAFFGVFFYRLTGEVLTLILLGLALFFVLVRYRNYWAGLLGMETASARFVLEQLDLLKQKHQARLESLRHLEKQVTSLLDLFELARDFGEVLSFGAVADQLFRKVMPVLPFQQMKLMVKTKSEESPVLIFNISLQGVIAERNLNLLSAEERIFLDEPQGGKKIAKGDKTWFFPLSQIQDLKSGLTVQGAESDDLAKFEVLASFLALQIKKIRLYDEVKELSIRDGLTGLFVRRHFLERFEEELKRSINYRFPLAVLMLDIDHFKRYNDDHGHLTGDATLRQVASLLRESLRQVDILARYGGEEFIVAIPETKPEVAMEIAERIRSSIARHHFEILADKTKVTVSVGGALFPTDGGNDLARIPVSELALQLIQFADKALYRAKEEGRNRVIFYKDL
ncbi:MAG: GGDEF domain-containing protein [Candidatus Omnitrophica bacterium]|nr:GGDEF domain-containing protein [Candidatus Omnitrophota bacterium]